MSVLIIGGDYIESIKKELRRRGVKEIHHVSGRNASEERKKKIPNKVGLILVLGDYLNHNTLKGLKEQAKKDETPVIFSRRSLGHVITAFEQWKARNRHCECPA